MRNVIAIATAVVADAIRRKVLWVVLLFAGILAAAIPQLPTYGIGVVAAVFREIGLALIFVAALVIMLSLAANRIPGEAERRTLYNVLAKRVHRWQYLTGTWLGLVCITGIAVAAFTLVTQGVGFLRYGDPMWRMWEGAFGIWLEMDALAAFAVAVSAATGPVVVVVASLVFLFFAHSRDTLLGSSPSGILALLYPSFDTFDVINPVAHGSGISLAYAGTMLVVFAGWSAFLLLLGVMAFSSRDL
jgi:ABC-type transport system involved in multi-copper enzyme maturation permease subunit